MRPLLDQVLSATMPAKTSLPSRAEMEVEAERLAASMPPLHAGASHARESVDPGAHGRRRAGTGESFWQFRRFQEGDFRSDIDWRASARYEHLHVREREKESPVRFRLWWSATTRMTYRSNARLPYKVERAALLLLALSRLLRRGGEQVEVFADDTDAPLPTSMASKSGASCVILASDFLDAPEDWEEQLRRLAARRTRGYLLHIIDPAEADFPFEGRTGFANAKGVVRQLLGSAEDCAPEYHDRFITHCEKIESIARALGWSLLRHRTDTPAEDALLDLHRRLSDAGAPR